VCSQVKFILFNAFINLEPVHRSEDGCDITTTRGCCSESDAFQQDGASGHGTTLTVEFLRPKS